MSDLDTYSEIKYNDYVFFRFEHNKNLKSRLKIKCLKKYFVWIVLIFLYINLYFFLYAAPMDLQIWFDYRFIKILSLYKC